MKTVILLVVSVLVFVVMGGIVSANNCSGGEIPNNNIDEDCDGWFAMNGFRQFEIRAEHPKLLMNYDDIPALIDRATNESNPANSDYNPSDPNSPESMKSVIWWFNRVKGDVIINELYGATESQTAALVYIITGNESFAQMAKDRISTTYAIEYTGSFKTAITYDWLLAGDRYWNKSTMDEFYLDPGYLLSDKDYIISEYLLPALDIFYDESWINGLYPHETMWPQHLESYGKDIEVFVIPSVIFGEVNVPTQHNITEMLIDAYDFHYQYWVPDLNIAMGYSFPGPGYGLNYYRLAPLILEFGYNILNENPYDGFQFTSYSPKVLYYSYYPVPFPESRFDSDTRYHTYFWGDSRIYLIGTNELLLLLALRNQDELALYMYEDHTKKDGVSGLGFLKQPGYVPKMYHFPYEHKLLWYQKENLPVNKSLEELNLSKTFHTGNYMSKFPTDTACINMSLYDGKNCTGPGLILMRSEIGNQNATFAMIKYGDKGGRDNADNLHFEISRNNGLLTFGSGARYSAWGEQVVDGDNIIEVYIYNKISSSKNVVNIYNPNAAIKYRWEGEEYVPDYAKQQSQYRAWGYTYRKGGDLISYLDNDEITYMRMNGTYIYDSMLTDQVEREFLYLRSNPPGSNDFFIVFDRVDETQETFDISIDDLENGLFGIYGQKVDLAPGRGFALKPYNSSKRWLLHMENVPKIWDGSNWIIPPDGDNFYETNQEGINDLMVFNAVPIISDDHLGEPGEDANDSKMFVKSLLPKNKAIRIIGQEVNHPVIKTVNTGTDRVWHAFWAPGTLNESGNVYDYTVSYSGQGPNGSALWSLTNFPAGQIPLTNVEVFTPRYNGQNYFKMTNNSQGGDLLVTFDMPFQCVGGSNHGNNCYTLGAFNTSECPDGGTCSLIADPGDSTDIIVDIDAQMDLRGLTGMQFYQDHLTLDGRGGNVLFHFGDRTVGNYVGGVYNENVNVDLGWKQAMGLWRIETIPKGDDVTKFNNFLHILYPTDADKQMPNTNLIEASNAYGAHIKDAEPNVDKVAIFSSNGTKINNLTYTLDDTSNTVRHLILDTEPGTYYVYKNGIEITGSPFDASDQGTLYFESQGGSEFIITGGGAVTCYDVNNDAVVNIIDLALVAYHQGQDALNPDYDHLDVNEDGMINYDDVTIIINNLGGAC